MSKIELFYEDTQSLKLHRLTLNKYVKILINRELNKMGEISVILCSDKYLLEINIEYLKHNYYTDIITFNYVEGKVISGDLFISVDRVKENSREFNTGFIKELYRVIFHGILHLIGYNDKTEEEQKVMRRKEDLYLSEVDFSELEI